LPFPDLFYRPQRRRGSRLTSRIVTSGAIKVISSRRELVSRLEGCREAALPREHEKGDGEMAGDLPAIG